MNSYKALIRVSQNYGDVNAWITVQADNILAARLIFINMYGEHNLIAGPIQI